MCRPHILGSSWHTVKMRKLRPRLFKYLLKSRSKKVAETGPTPVHYSLLKREHGGLAWERTYLRSLRMPAAGCTALAPVTDSRLGAGLLNNSPPLQKRGCMAVSMCPCPLQYITTPPDPTVPWLPGEYSGEI